jgi:hypothetical protein
MKYCAGHAVAVPPEEAKSMLQVPSTVPSDPRLTVQGTVTGAVGLGEGLQVHHTDRQQHLVSSYMMCCKPGVVG